MSLTTVHHLSMSVRHASIAGDGTVTHGTVETFTFTGLPNVAYTVTWDTGDAVTSSVTMNSSGTGTATKNYTAAGTKTVTLNKTSNGQLWATQSVVVV